LQTLTGQGTLQGEKEKDVVSALGLGTYISRSVATCIGGLRWPACMRYLESLCSLQVFARLPLIAKFRVAACARCKSLHVQRFASILNPSPYPLPHSAKSVPLPPTRTHEIRLSTFVLFTMLLLCANLDITKRQSVSIQQTERVTQYGYLPMVRRVLRQSLRRLRNVLR